MDTAQVVEVDALEHLLRERHSCRGFDPAPLDRATIERLMTMAQRTPSWCNVQPWRLVVCSGAATQLLAEALTAHVQGGAAETPDIPFPERYSGAHLERRRECGWQLYEAVGVARGDRAGSAAQGMENFRFFGAPHFALVTAPRELGPYGVLDCGGYVSTFLLAAQSLGVAAIAQAAVAAYADWLRDWFGLREDRVVVCGLSFGRAAPGHAANRFRTNRAELDEVIDWRE